MDARKLVLITLASIKICYILIESKASYFINLYVKLRFYLNIVSFNVLLTVLESYDYFSTENNEGNKGSKYSLR